tara:strand:+ start:488 stop:760 length:273 start_codon:yes stop_codon:yes gene_type:complete
MPHSTTNFIVSDALIAIANGINRLDELQWIPPEDRLGVLTSIGIIIMAVQDEFGVEYFSDDEVDFINNASMAIENHLAELHADGVFDFED